MIPVAGGIRNRLFQISYCATSCCTGSLAKTKPMLVRSLTLHRSDCCSAPGTANKIPPGSLARNLPAAFRPNGQADRWLVRLLCNPRTCPGTPSFGRRAAIVEHWYLRSQVQYLPGPVMVFVYTVCRRSHVPQANWGLYRRATTLHRSMMNHASVARHYFRSMHPFIFGEIRRDIDVFVVVLIRRRPPVSGIVITTSGLICQPSWKLGEAASPSDRLPGRHFSPRLQWWRSQRPKAGDHLLNRPSAGPHARAA